MCFSECRQSGQSESAVQTANPTEVIIAETEQGRAILGVVDGNKSQGIETTEDIDVRKKFLRTIGYKL